MAININLTYPGRVTAPDADYNYGSSKNESSPGAGDGTPYELVRANDIFGLQQALLRSASIVPSNSADTQLVSEYLQSIIELSSGRAFTYDDSGAADAYVMGVRTNQQAPASLFEGQVLKFTPANTNTGASTANPFGKGVTNIKLEGGTSDPLAGQITAGEEVILIYRTAPSVHLELVVSVARSSRTSKAWVNFDGTGVVSIFDSINISSITDNGTGNYVVNLINAMNDSNGCAVSGGQNSAAGTNRLTNTHVLTTTTIAVTSVVAATGAFVDLEWIGMVVFSN